MKRVSSAWVTSLTAAAWLAASGVQAADDPQAESQPATAAADETSASSPNETPAQNASSETLSAESTERASDDLIELKTNEPTE